MGRKKRAKTCDTLSHVKEDRISQLPEHLISEILFHLPTKEAVSTSVLSSKWRNTWRSVPALDLYSAKFSNFDAFLSFVERFLDSNREESTAHSSGQLRKFWSNFHDLDGRFKDFPTRWVDALTRRRIQQIDLTFFIFYPAHKVPALNIYTCKTLVHLRLRGAKLANAESVSLPCLKIIYLEYVKYPNESTLEKLISESPVLEDLTLVSLSTANATGVQVCSKTLKRIRIHKFQVVIDAPLLECIRTEIESGKDFEIINVGSFAKLDIDVALGNATYNISIVPDILTDICRWVRDLVLSSNVFWKDILLYSNSGPVLHFRDLSRLDAKFSKSDLEMLPTILESCPRLEYFRLELVKDKSKRRERKKDPKVMFATVPQCLETSLKFVELKRLIPGYEGEIKLVRYLLKNSKILEKLRLDVYYTQKKKCDFLKELVSSPRCSTACEVLVL
ncbi:hypothetical protein CARUB_v10026398mg [Capsella rubella]|uniref:F-box domain-containing protein n=2 Tax=Capsella rubella TaxID=81985 RepID=R0EW02_9BRAS|nr:hypothetical protein CARUB_v10026398mg [Capsella rubella]